MHPDTTTEGHVGWTVALLRARRSFDSNSGPDAFTALTDVSVGTPVEIYARESHGSNPWTRWTARTVEPLGEGEYRRQRVVSGLVAGEDF